MKFSIKDSPSKFDRSLQSPVFYAVQGLKQLFKLQVKVINFFVFTQ